MAYWWNVDSLTINTGSIDSGAVSDTHTNNGQRLVLNELSSAPGFSYDFVFENIPGSVEYFRFVMNGYYDSDPYHEINCYIYNYNFGLWLNAGVIIPQVGDITYYWMAIPTAFGWTNSGQAKIRFIQESAGNTSNKLRIDMLRLTDMTITNTTHAPTTLVPTTTPPTPVPTTTLTTASPTTAPPTSVAPTTIIPTTSPPVTTLTTPPPHDHDNDVLFNCFGNNYAGVLIIEISITGNSLSASYGLDDLELNIPITITGCVPVSALHYMEDFELSIEISIEGWGVANDNLKNWVAWSKIGDVSFVLDRTNDAGRRPMSWAGYVYQTLQLGNNVIIYGSGGVTRAFPVSSPMPTFGFKDISKVGVKNKTAVGGDQFIHFYIDVLGCLCAVVTSTNELGTSSIKMQKLGYEEFLLPLTNPVLSWDAGEQRLHISDEDKGYVFNDSVLTGGYGNLTGLYRIKDDLKVVSPDELVVEPVYITTDITDFKRRGLKTIENVNTDIISDLPIYGSYCYRYKKTEEFKNTEWVQLNDSGVLNLKCTATEFRVNIKSIDNGTFDMSYMRIHFKFVDQRFTHDNKEEIDVY